MSSEQELREWLDDEVTRRQLDRLHGEIKGATKDLLHAGQSKSLDEIRARDGYRRGLLRAWQLLAPKASRDGEDQET